MCHENVRRAFLGQSSPLVLLLVLGACGGGGGGGSDSTLQAPTGVQASSAPGDVMLTWNAVAGATSYNLYCASRSGVTKTNWDSLPDGFRRLGVSSPHHETTLAEGVEYFFVLTALDAHGESPPSLEVSATAHSTPGAPVGLTATAGNGRVTLQWMPVAGASSYNVYRALESGVNRSNYASLAGGERLDAASSPWVVDGLANQSNYFFVVTAETALVEGPESLQVAAAPFTSGWFWQNPLPTGNVLHRVKFVDASTGWIVGNAGTILHTIDGGSTWSTQTSGTTSALLDVDCVNALTGWAVGGSGPYGATYGTILHTVDAGATWSLQASGAVPVLNGVTFLDAARGWAVGDDGTILHTSDGGTTWTLQASPTTAPLWKVAFVDALTGFVAGGSGAPGVVLRTVDGGETWSSQTFLQSQLYDLSFPTPARGWMVDAATPGRVFATNDGGDSWGALATPTTAFLLGIDFIDELSGWAVGTSGRILSSTNSGGSWNLQDSGTASHLQSVEAVDTGHVWAVGNGGVILHARSGGPWQPQHHSSWNSTPAFLDASFPDPSNGWIVGRSILHTADGGEHWTVQVATTPDLLWGVDFVNALEGWAVGDGGVLLNTIDGGSTWNAQDGNGANQLWCVDFLDSDVGLAAGPSGTIRTTTDGGASWVRRTPGSSTVFQGACVVDPDTAWVVGDGGVILKTTDGGATWLGQLSGTLQSLRAVHALDAQRACAVGGNGATPPLLLTTDGGDHWFAVASTPLGWFTDVEFANASVGWVVGSEGMIFRTDDGGLTWERQNSATTEDFYAVSALGPTTAWALGHGLLKTTTGGL